MHNFTRKHLLWYEISATVINRIRESNRFAYIGFPFDTQKGKIPKH